MHGCTVARNHFHRSTFSFSESRTAFSFADKRKSGFGPCWAGKNQLQDKNTPLSCKRKSGFTRRGVRPTRKAARPPTAGLWPQLGKRKNNPPSGRPQPSREGVPFRQRKSRFVKFLCRADKISAPTKVRWLAEKRLPARSTPHPRLIYISSIVLTDKPW